MEADNLASRRRLGLDDLWPTQAGHLEETRFFHVASQPTETVREIENIADSASAIAADSGGPLTTISIICEQARNQEEVPRKKGSD